MQSRRLGSTDLDVSSIGYGAFKIGRNQKIKYAAPYDLPTDEEVRALLHALLDLGVSYIDTAPAYGLSEERIGAALGDCSEEFTLSTKVGEEFTDGASEYCFDRAHVTQSIERSLRRVRRDVLDLVYVHAPADDLDVIRDTDVVPTLQSLRDVGKVRYIGFSGKTVGAARAALTWADALMVEYHLENRTHAPVIAEAAERGVGVVVKKGLASGRLDPAGAIEFLLSNPAIDSMVVGGLNIEHVRANVEIAERVRARPADRAAAHPITERDHA